MHASYHARLDCMAGHLPKLWLNITTANEGGAYFPTYDVEPRFQKLIQVIGAWSSQAGIDR